MTVSGGVDLVEALSEATPNAIDQLAEQVPLLASAYEAVLVSAGHRMAERFGALAVSLTADATFTPPDEDEVADSEVTKEEMRAASAEIVEDAAEVVGDAFGDAGISFEVDQFFTQDMLDAVGERAAFAADETLRNTYRGVLTEAAEEGWSIPRTAEAIVEKVDGVSVGRAEALARTDLVGMANGASVHVATVSKRPEEILYKEWLATNDGLTRETHADAHGQRVLVNEVFEVGDDRLNYPGDPFGSPEEVMNCRCTIIYSSVAPIEVEADPLANVTPSQETVEWQEANWANWSPEYRMEIEEGLRGQLADAPIHIRVPGETAVQNVIPDGRFKSQFETTGSRGLFDPNFRAKAEGDLFSYDADLEPVERPIYGYVGEVTSEESMVTQYGEATFVLKDDVRKRATWTQTDSLGTGVVPSPIERPSHLSLMDPGSQDNPLFGLDNPLPFDEFGYVEAQIHGGVSLDDVKHIDYWTYPSERAFGQEMAERIRAALAEAGYGHIAVRLREHSSIGLGISASGADAVEQLVRVDTRRNVLPVAASDDRGRRSLGRDRLTARIEDAPGGAIEVLGRTRDENEEVVLAARGNDLHGSHDRAEGRRSERLALEDRRPGGVPSRATEEENMSATEAITAAGVVTERVALNQLEPIQWDSILCVEGEPTEDMRLLEAGSIRWRDLPLTLMGTLETSYGHLGAKAAGRIDSITRAGVNVEATGDFTSKFGIQELAPLVDDRTVRGVSVDLAVFDFEYRDPETGEVLSDEEAFERWWTGEPMLFVVLDGVIIAATVCPMPAIANAEIAISASAGLATISPEQRGIIASALKEGGYGDKVSPADVKVISVFTPFDAKAKLPSLISSAVNFATETPPREHFELTEFPGKTPLTVTDDGRVFGHIATWDTCHVGIPGVCTMAPRSRSNYAYFHTGAYAVAEGGTVDVGRLMLGTGHASLAASRENATRHYDQPDKVGAYVRAYDGEHGIWVSGVVRPELTAAGLRELRANPPSGDWRKAAGALELIAVCAVAVPGFPVPRAEANITASAGGLDLDSLIASSGVILPTQVVKDALIAAGCGCEEMDVADELLEDIAALA
jgi:hypothetical protein